MRDYKGQKYHQLTLIADAGPGGGTRGRYWQAQCDCGNVIVVPGKDVAAGRVRRCANCVKGLTEVRKRRGGYRARSAEEARGRHFLLKVHRKALREGVNCALDYSHLRQLDLRKCFLCRSELSVNTLYLEYVRPEVGYTVANVEPICPECRHHKGKANLLQFLEYLLKVKKVLDSGK